MADAEAELDERPVTDPPDVPLWSENYLFQAYDPSTGYGVWLHLGLPSFDAGLWHGISIIYLPGGTHALIAKDFSARCQGGPADSGMLAAEPTENGGWSVRFRGAAQRVAVADLDAGPAVDGRCEPVVVDLAFSGLSRKPMDLRRAVTDQPWANAHWEQPCSALGTLTVGSEQVRFAGSGVRDHSRGPRDLRRMGSHRFLHGQFPDGRCFGLIHMTASDGSGAAMSHGYLVEDGRLEHAEVVDVAMGTVTDPSLSLTLRSADGEHQIFGEILHDVALTIDYPNEVLFGTRRGARHVIREAQARWSWAGRTGFGLAERSALLSEKETEE